MSTFTNTLTQTLESLLVLFGTFVLALTVMGAFGGLTPVELWLAVVESIAAVALWRRYFQRPV